MGKIIHVTMPLKWTIMSQNRWWFVHDLHFSQRELQQCNVKAYQHFQPLASDFFHGIRLTRMSLTG